jgi:hypothetical protein
MIDSMKNAEFIGGLGVIPSAYHHYEFEPRRLHSGART